VDLAPSAYQVAFLTACPGTDFYKRMKDAGRIHPNYSYTDIQVWNEDTFISENFTRKELKPLYDLTHEMLFEQNGPTIMRNVDVHLNGYETCMKSNRKLLREQKSEMFKDSCTNMFPVLEACRKYGPSETARAHAEAVIEKYKRLLGEPTEQQKMFSKVFCDVIAAETERLGEERESAPCDPPPRWTYYNQGNTPEPLVKKGRGAGKPVPYEFVKTGASGLAL
jgi:hypothetical protein